MVLRPPMSPAAPDFDCSACQGSISRLFALFAQRPLQYLQAIWRRRGQEWRFDTGSRRYEGTDAMSHARDITREFREGGAIYHA